MRDTSGKLPDDFQAVGHTQALFGVQTLLCFRVQLDQRGLFCSRPTNRHT
jgi:hypothetical protein